jgi:hypothetical protein
VSDEFLKLFEIQSILTLAQRPQANALAERNGGEVMRHLRALLLDKVIRSIWSVLLPLVMRVINRAYKQSIGTTPHRLIHWAPTDLDRGIFAPFREHSEPLPLKSTYVRALEGAYENLLDTTSLHILAEQKEVSKQYEGAVPTEFKVGSFVLMSYLTRPPSKLHTRWEGPFEVMSRDRNNVIIRDLTSDARREVDANRLRVFYVGKNVDPKGVATADLGEASVEIVLEHRGSPTNRASMEFLVRWTDSDETWEPWEQVKKLAAIDQYIRAHPEARLKSLLPKK